MIESSISKQTDLSCIEVHEIDHDLPQQLLHSPSEDAPTSYKAPSLSGATVAVVEDSVEVASKNSESSRAGSQRNGSITTLHRSMTTPTSADGTAAERYAGGTATTRGPQEKKAKGGLFSFLNCCAAPDDANDLDTPVPMKRVTNISTQGAPTTANKPNTASTDQGASATDDPPAQKPIIVEGHSTINGNGSIIANGAPNGTHGIPALAEGTSTDSGTMVTGEAGPSKESLRLGDTTSATIATSSESQGSAEASPDAVLKSPSPVTTIDEPASVPLAVSDVQTSDQEDEVMTDAEDPPVIISSQENSLPGPPPLPTNAESKAAVISRPSMSAQESPNEKQWLLPPITQRFKGKKCLVLDLDETLVHSSFKVCAPRLIVFRLSQCSRYYTRRISPYRSRLKDSTIMCMS